MPAAEVDVDEALVTALLADQHPDLAGLAVRFEANGWDNAMFRLGDEFCVRLPRRTVAADLMLHEQRWLPDLAPRLPLPIPVPVRVGAAALGFPWSWSVCPWFAGASAAATVWVDATAAAVGLGEFIRALHADASPAAPRNDFRGGALLDRNVITVERIAALSAEIDGPAIRHAWDDAVAAPRWNGSPRWLHGDLHPANIVVADGVIAAVIDWGDLTAGDPATDLAVAWMLFDRAERVVFRANAGDIDDDTWDRARGWAVSLALAYLVNSADSPTMAGIGTRTLAAVLADDSRFWSGSGGLR